MRGFRNRDIGPVDQNNEPLGGETMFYQNTELTFPIMDRVRGAIFNDVGALDPIAYHYVNAIERELNAGRRRGPAPEPADWTVAAGLRHPVQGPGIQPQRLGPL